MPKHRRTTSVRPPSPITNRRTGAETPFGPRRAYDGAYILELLSASGCTKADIDAALFVLQPLVDHGFGDTKADALIRLFQLSSMIWKPAKMGTTGAVPIIFEAKSTPLLVGRTTRRRTRAR